MKTAKNRRKKNRWPVTVLVKITIPKLGEELLELEMWAKDVNEGGLKLELTKGLNIGSIHQTGLTAGTTPVRLDDIQFQKGLKLKIQDLFYDDDGSPYIEGKISWIKHTPGGIWTLGVTFDTKKSKDAEGAFKDFLSIVKNPTEAIAKATRRK